MLKIADLQLTKKLMIGILFFAFAVRVAAIFVIGDSKLDHEYATLVPNLMNGKGYSYYSLTQDGTITNEYVPNAVVNMPSAFKPPIYSMLVAATGFIVGIDTAGMIVIEVIQAFFGAIICWLIYDVARMKFNKHTAFWALMISSVYPLLVFATGQISDLTLQVFLRCFLFWLLIKLEEQPTSRALIILTGLSLGALLTARTEMWLYLPFILLWIIWALKEKWLRAFAPIMTIALIVVAPWIIRNYIQFGAITLNTSGGINLWEGQNENAKGIPSWYTWPPAELTPEAEAQVAALEATDDYEIRLDAIYFNEAKSFMLSHPGQSLQLGIRKFIYYWGSVYPGVEFIYSNADSPFYWLPWLCILPFFIAGLVMNLRSFRKHFLFHVSFALSTFTVMLFFVLPKYILFAMPWVLVFAASAIAVLVDKILQKAYGRSNFMRE
jgi:4-amino-4-deoxy-L-arabinose transferase-like glycosyltransferase